jgi:hypothetical protein
MRISKERFKRIILEEQQRLQEDLDKDEEARVARIVYILLGKAREKFEDYLGELIDGEEASPEFNLLHDAVGDAWRVADKILTGGETKDALPNLFEIKTDLSSLSSEFDVSVQRLVNSITRKDEPDVAHKFMELYKQISNRSETGEADFYQELGRALKEIGGDVEAHGHQSEEPTSKIGRSTLGRSPSVERGDVFRSPGMPDIRIDERENSNLAKKRIREKQKK